MASGGSRVLVADDHPLFRLGLTVVLEQHGFEVVGQADRGDDALALALARRPDLVLLDVRMPGMDGIEVCRHLSDALPDVRCAMISTYSEPAVRRNAVAAGAVAFFGKDTAPDEIAHWCRRLLDEPGLRLLGLDSDTVDEAPLLSQREHEVLRLLARGYSNKRIAAELALSPETVKDHCARLYAKFATRDRTSTVGRARDLGFFTTSDHPP